MHFATKVISCIVSYCILEAFVANSLNAGQFASDGAVCI